jgi:excisionase family DNA binding protein
VNTETQKDILTTEQLAEKLQLSQDKIRDLVRDKTIPVIRLNQRLWRFHWPTVLEWLKK